MNLNAEQKEDLRHAVRAALVIRHPAALAPRQLQRALKKDLDFLFEESDVVAALELLRGLNQAEFTVDELGSNHYWRITAAGVLAEERS
jgi:hypothetical protein